MMQKRLVVIPRIHLLLSIGMTCVIYLFCILEQKLPFSLLYIQNDSGIVDWIIFLIANLFILGFGPYGILIYSWKIVLEKDAMTMYRFLWMRKTVLTNSNVKLIKLVKYSDKSQSSWIIIVFNDSINLKIDSFAAGFIEFWNYLESDSNRFSEQTIVE